MVKEPKITINIGDTDENADWIKTPENRASEAAIHNKLARDIQRSGDITGGAPAKEEE